WWPDPLIPFAGTCFQQQTQLVVEPGASLLFADSLLAGRVARGEQHAYRALEFTTVASRPDGTVLFRDTLHLRPEARPPRALGLLGQALAVGTFYLIGPGVV